MPFGASLERTLCVVGAPPGGRPVDAEAGQVSRGRGPQGLGELGSSEDSVGPCIVSFLQFAMLPWSVTAAVRLRNGGRCAG